MRSFEDLDNATLKVHEQAGVVAIVLIRKHIHRQHELLGIIFALQLLLHQVDFEFEHTPLLKPKAFSSECHALVASTAPNVRSGHCQILNEGVIVVCLEVELLGVLETDDASPHDSLWVLAADMEGPALHMLKGRAHQAAHFVPVACVSGPRNHICRNDIDVWVL